MALARDIEWPQTTVNKQVTWDNRREYIDRRASDLDPHRHSPSLPLFANRIQLSLLPKQLIE